MAEHSFEGPAIGVIFDGTGYGTDGAIWGGEILCGGFDSFERLMHLKYVLTAGRRRQHQERPCAHGAGAFMGGGHGMDAQSLGFRPVELRVLRAPDRDGNELRSHQ